MDQGPLVIEEIDAGAEFARRFEAHRPVKAAFWLKASDDDRRYLYIAADEVDGSGLRSAYREVNRLAGEMRTPYLDPSRVKLIGGSDPLTQAAIDINQRFADDMANRLRNTMFGGLFVDEVYIYPTPIPAAN